MQYRIQHFPFILCAISLHTYNGTIISSRCSFVGVLGCNFPPTVFILPHLFSLVNTVPKFFHSSCVGLQYILDSERKKKKKIDGCGQLLWTVIRPQRPHQQPSNAPLRWALPNKFFLRSLSKLIDKPTRMLYDTALMKNYFGTLRTECLYLCKLASSEQVKAPMDEYVHFLQFRAH